MKGKHNKSNRNKPVFLISLDRLDEDSSYESCQMLANHPASDDPNSKLEFPLPEQIQELHQDPENQDLSTYLQTLQRSVKSICNDIEKEYMHTRQTVFYLSKMTGFKNTQRAKIDQQLEQIKIERPYQSEIIPLTSFQEFENDDILDVGDIALERVKQKIRNEWEGQLQNELWREKRKKAELEKKRQKEQEFMYKQLQKAMKKRMVLKEKEQQLQRQQQKQLHNNRNNSMNSIESNGSISDCVSKKMQLSLKKSRKSDSDRQSSNNNFEESAQQAESLSILAKNLIDNPIQNELVLLNQNETGNNG